MKSHLTSICFCLYMLLFSSSCTPDEPKKYIIYNESSDTLVIEAGKPGKPWVESLIPWTREAFECNVYLPKSKKSFKGFQSIDYFMGDSVLFLYAYRYYDVMRMSFEEFNRVNPVQHIWVVTRESWEESNWTIVYPADESQRRPFLPE